MAGVKGRSGGARPNTGGARPGAGRKPKPAPEPVLIPECDMLTLLQDIALGRVEATATQVRAAIAAVRPEHAVQAALRGWRAPGRLFLVAIGVFFPIYINTYHGIRSVDPQLIEMGKSYGLTRWQLYKEIILPGAMPSILVGLRFSLGLVWVLLIVAETISAQSGIGYMTMNAREFLQTDIVLVGILLYALLGKLADVLAVTLEKYLLRWHAGYQK